MPGPRRQSSPPSRSWAPSSAAGSEPAIAGTGRPAAPLAVRRRTAHLDSFNAGLPAAGYGSA